MRLRDITRVLAVALLVANLPVGRLGAGTLAPARVLSQAGGDGDQHPLMGQLEAATGRPALSARRPTSEPGRAPAALTKAVPAFVARVGDRSSSPSALGGQAHLLPDVHSCRGPPLG